MIRTILSFFLILVCTTIVANSANTKELLAAAERGNPVAELNYAKEIFPTSRQEAFVWARKAANKGLAEAWFWLGENTIEEESIGYYAQAAKLGCKDAYQKVVDASLFAGKNNNFARAKEFADMARQKNISVGMNQSDSQEKLDTVDRCFAAGKIIIPSSDRPSATQLVYFQKIKRDCLDYKYGLGVEIDLVKYRLCLLSQKNLDNTSLAEIYANGWGVKRNPNLAISLICYADNLAPAELTGMVNVLYQSSKELKLAKSFKFCENITSGYNMGVCAAEDERVNATNRAKKIQQITANWPEKDRLALQKLLIVAKQFFKQHAENEQDISGTIGSANVIDEQAKLYDQLLTSLQNFEAGKLPSNTNIKQADLLLNQTYIKVMQLNYNDYNMGSMSKEGIKATENKWLKYREAWVKFSEQRYPNTKPDVWRVWVTMDRVQQLNAILELG